MYTVVSSTSFDPLDFVIAVGGRNRKCAEAFARAGGKRSFDELEAEMLQGQKLQVYVEPIIRRHQIIKFVFITPTHLPKFLNMKGVSTAKEVYEVLRHRGWLELFPLFTTVHEISTGRRPPTAIVEFSELRPKFPLVEGSA